MSGKPETRIVKIGDRDFTVTNQRTERMRFRAQQYYSEFINAPEQERFLAYYYWRYVSSVKDLLIYTPAEFGDLPEGATDEWAATCEVMFPEWSDANPTPGESEQTPPPQTQQS